MILITGATGTVGRQVVEQLLADDQPVRAVARDPDRAGLPDAHCYRMLGSVTEAEDALQETLLRAWRGLASFEGQLAALRDRDQRLPAGDRAAAQAGASDRLRPCGRPP
jgi:uncharacterized protein YbjT (DUF2867 family)